MTQKHLRDLYGNPPYRFSVYDSSNLFLVRAFALSDGLEIMVMTIDAFARAENVIKIPNDLLQGEKPIHLIQAARPILLLDEPQNMESENRVKALAALHPLFALRYSATHRNPYNVIYRLTPYEAYRQRLVKRIEVASVVQEDNANLPFIRVEDIATAKRTLTTRMAVHKLMKTGVIKETVLTFRPGEDLAEKTGRPEYEGFIIDEINYGGRFVRFTNNVELRRGAEVGAEREMIFEAQIHTSASKRATAKMASRCSRFSSSTRSPISLQIMASFASSISKCSMSLRCVFQTGGTSTPPRRRRPTSRPRRGEAARSST
jgi:type III restriction enzyme